MQSRDVGHNNENGPRSRKIKYVSLSYILDFRATNLPLSTPSAVVTVRLVMCQMCTILSCTNSKNFACKDFTCLATVSLHMHKSLAPKMVVCLSPYCMINNSSLAKDFFLSHIFHIPYLHGRFFWKMKFTSKMPSSFVLILQNCQLIIIM